MKRLEAFNAAKEIAAAEKKQKVPTHTVSATVPTISPTPAENQHDIADKAVTVN